MRGWNWVLGSGLGALVSAATAALCAFAGILIGSDEAMAAKPFYAAFLVLSLVAVGLAGVCGASLVRTVAACASG
ncbi:MAG: hypothetical protein AB8I08_03165 [Sandaracinaceae bacterium]